MSMLYMYIFYTCIGINVGFPGGTSGKQLPDSAWDIKDPGSVPGLGRSPGGGDGTPLFLPENLMDRGAWWATVHRVTKSWI